MAELVHHAGSESHDISLGCSYPKARLGQEKLPPLWPPHKLVLALGRKPQIPVFTGFSKVHKVYQLVSSRVNISRESQTKGPCLL